MAASRSAHETAPVSSRPAPTARRATRRHARSAAAACALLAAAASVPLAARATTTVEGELAAQFATHLHETPPRVPVRGLQLNLKYEAQGDELRLHAQGRLRWNDAYRSPAYARESREAYRLSADWRELHATGRAGRWNLSAGLQQVVWGRADELRVLDIVNPLDLREFVLPGLGAARRPVPMLRAVRAIGDDSLELLYLPWFVPTRPALPGSAFGPPVPPADAAPVLLPERRPARRLRSGELGLHWSRSQAGLDLSGHLFITREDEPVYRRVAWNAAPGEAWQASYPRRRVAGVSIARGLGDALTLRTEWAVSPRSTFAAGRPGGDGTARGTVIDGLVGLDRVWRDWMLTAQWSGHHLRAWQPGDPGRRHTGLVTLALSGSSFGARLDTRVAWTRYLNRDDGAWLQLKATWKPGDRSEYTLGADVFSGRPAGMFGAFDAHDRLQAQALFRF